MILYTEKSSQFGIAFYHVRECTPEGGTQPSGSVNESGRPMYHVDLYASRPNGTFYRTSKGIRWSEEHLSKMQSVNIEQLLSEIKEANL